MTIFAYWRNKKLKGILYHLIYAVLEWHSYVHVFVSGLNNNMRFLYFQNGMQLHNLWCGWEGPARAPALRRPVRLSYCGNGTVWVHSPTLPNSGTESSRSACSYICCTWPFGALRYVVRSKSEPVVRRKVCVTFSNKSAVCTPRLNGQIWNWIQYVSIFL